jgi:hypothetical protein
MAFGTPDDDQTPQYDPLTQLLSGYNPPGAPQQAVADPAAQQNIGPTPAQTAPVAQAQPDQATAAPPAATVALAPAPPADPSVPQAPRRDYDAYNAIAAKKATDAVVDRKANAPKWYDRLAGAAVGFGAGFRGDVAGAIKTGGEITNRRMEEATADSQQKVAADQAQLDQLDREAGQKEKDYELQTQQFGQGREVAEDARTQANSDRNFNEEHGKNIYTQTRDTANDAYTHGRDDRLDKQGQQNFETTSAETRRRDSAEMGNASERLKIERQKADNDANENSPAAALLKARAAVDQTHDEMLNHLEFGDPKASNEDERAGFKATYAALGSSKKDPVSGQPWKPGERDAALANMLEIHNQQKQGIEASRQQQQSRLQSPPASPAAKAAAVAPQGFVPPAQTVPGAQPPPAAAQNPNAAPPAVPQVPPGTEHSLKTAMGLAFNKGKSAAQVTADLKSRGYVVVP